MICHHPLVGTGSPKDFDHGHICLERDQADKFNEDMKKGGAHFALQKLLENGGGFILYHTQEKTKKSGE